jgi:hypothetical protein
LQLEVQLVCCHPNISRYKPDISLRHWSLRWFWLCFGNWWPSITYHSLWLDWRHVILHSPCPWRTSRCIPDCGCFLGLLESIHWPCLGFRNGLEVSPVA